MLVLDKLPYLEAYITIHTPIEGQVEKLQTSSRNRNKHGNGKDHGN